MSRITVKFRLRLLFQEVDLLPGRFTLGRGTSCSLTIDDPLVSREHAEITVGEDEATIRDLGSRNGTQVNGEPLAAAARLRHGDGIRVGGYEFVFIVHLPGLPGELRSTVEVGGRPELAIPDESTAPVTVADLEKISDSVARRSARMIDEVISMALSMGHHDRAAELIDKQIAGFERKLASQGFGVDDLVRLSEFNLAAGNGLGQPSRIRWVIDRWSELGRAMPVELASKIDGAARGVCDPRPEISRYLSVLTSSRVLSDSCPELIERLQEMV